MIQYRTDKNFEAEQLKELFSSVNWLSANYSERLVKALYNSSTVISAWDGEKLIGLINALDDGELNEKEALYYSEVTLRISQKLLALD